MLGDPAAHPLESLSVPVFMYARTYEAKLPTAKKWSALSDMQAGSQSLTHDVGKEVSYKVKGSNKQANGGGDLEAQTAQSEMNGSAEASTSEAAADVGNINSYDLEHAYPFGKSLVVITAEDEKFMKIETKAGMFILGFLSASSVRVIVFTKWRIILRPTLLIYLSLTLSFLSDSKRLPHVQCICYLTKTCRQYDCFCHHFLSGQSTLRTECICTGSLCFQGEPTTKNWRSCTIL